MAHRDFLKRASRTHYQRQRYHNPYFSRTKRTWPWKHILAWGGALIILILAASALLSSAALRIDSVTILGVRYTPKETLEEQINTYLQSRTWLFLRRSNQFLFNAQALQQNLQTQMNLFSVQVRMDGSRVEISIQERTPFLLWTTGEKTYVADLEGIIVREAVAEDLQESLPRFTEQDSLEVYGGLALLTKD